MATIDWRKQQEACLALLRALGVSDVERVVGFTLTCRADDQPTLTVERLVGMELADKTVQAAANGVAPQVEERAVWE